MYSAPIKLKRPAVDDDGNFERPSKRVEPGTPEEGELDDEEEGALQEEQVASTSQTVAVPAPTVAFPFKKKSVGMGGDGMMMTKTAVDVSASAASILKDAAEQAGKGVYVRSPTLRVDSPPHAHGHAHGNGSLNGRGGNGRRRNNDRGDRRMGGMDSYRPASPSYGNGRSYSGQPQGGNSWRPPRGAYDRDRDRGGPLPPPPQGYYAPNDDRHYVAPDIRRDRERDYSYDYANAPAAHLPPPPPRRPSPDRLSVRGSTSASVSVSARSPRSPRSPSGSKSRSGSPRSLSKSPSSSSRKPAKHRLPTRSSPQSGFSPLQSSSQQRDQRDPWTDRSRTGDNYRPDYGSGRDQRGGSGWGRDNNRDRDRYYGGGGGDYYDDRRSDYYEPNPNDWGGRGRSFQDPRENFSLDRFRHPHPRSPPRNSTYMQTGMDSYRPVSPGAYRPASPEESYRPVSPGQGQGPGPGFGTGFATGTGPGFPTGPLPTEPSAPKPHSPAPIAPRQSSTWDVNARAPSPVPMERRKDETLPSGRGVLSIPVKSIPGPEDARVPLVNKPVASASFSSAPAPKRREPFHRSREQEKAAYGRLFLGCGKKDDYELAIKLGEGTFGEVHKATRKSTGAAVALKRILMHNEKEGMPVTALREIKILKAMSHACVIELLDMFVVRSSKDSPLSVYMVFPYMDHDLAGLLENERVQLQPSHIKLFMKQLLEGTEYMHKNHILHRDMKAANLLISNDGCLKIADFGLARSYDPTIVHEPLDFHGKERKYTNCVVTRWYRPPELLLGARQYGGEVDIWGIGCVMGEMFVRRPILAGSSDMDQLDKIWALCGTPNQHTWPNFDALPGCDGLKRFTSNHQRRVKTVYENIGVETVDLLDKLLVCNPRERISASQALEHDYFWSDPLPAEPSSLKSMNWEPSHELDKRSRRQNPVGPPRPAQNQAQGQNQGQQQAQGGPLPPPGSDFTVLPPLHFNPGGGGGGGGGRPGPPMSGNMPMNTNMPMHRPPPNMPGMPYNGGRGGHNHNHNQNFRGGPPGPANFRQSGGMYPPPQSGPGFPPGPPMHGGPSNGPNGLPTMPRPPQGMPYPPRSHQSGPPYGPR